MCNQVSALVARALEETGIATVMISLLREVVEQVRPPRALHVPFPFGFPLGKPNDARHQRQIIRRCLEMLEEVSEPGTIWDLEVAES